MWFSIVEEKRRRVVLDVVMVWCRKARVKGSVVKYGIVKEWRSGTR